MKKVSMAFVALLLCFCFLLASCSDNAKMRELESENAALKEQLSKSSQTSSPSSSSPSLTFSLTPSEFYTQLSTYLTYQNTALPKIYVNASVTEKKSDSDSFFYEINNNGVLACELAIYAAGKNSPISSLILSSDDGTNFGYISPAVLYVLTQSYDTSALKSLFDEANQTVVESGSSTAVSSSISKDGIHYFLLGVGGRIILSLSPSSDDSSSSSSSSAVTAPSSDQGVQLHDDQYVTISFLGCEKGKYDEELVFQIVNKTNVELTFQSGSMALDGESLGHVSGSETVAAQSRGKVRFSTEEAFPTFFPNTISGNIAVIDFSKTIFENNKQSYDVDFVNVSLQ